MITLERGKKAHIHPTFLTGNAFSTTEGRQSQEESQTYWDKKETIEPAGICEQNIGEEKFGKGEEHGILPRG